MEESIEHFRAGSVSLHEINEGQSHWFVVMDPDLFRVSIVPIMDSGTLGVGIDAELSLEAPGQWANFTPTYENATPYCRLGEVSITDDGLLSVMSKATAPRIKICTGWTAQLPHEAVEPIRLAIKYSEVLLTNALAMTDAVIQAGGVGDEAA